MKPENRHYESTKLSTMDNLQEGILEKMYSEVNSNYRHLADIRFKLIGFLPAVSVIAWAQIFGSFSISSVEESLLAVVISFLGLRIAFGLRIYDQRNDNLYNDLISRGRKIEEELGIGTGIFKGRITPNQQDFIFRKIINHSRGLDIIYSSVFVGWGVVSIWYIYNLLILSFFS